MKTRHRIPSIFNLSMVDVLCCALGCVILLWLLNLREAKQRAALAGRAGADPAGARAEGARRARGAADLRARLAAVEQAAAERADLLRAERDRLAALEKSLA